MRTAIFISSIYIGDAFRKDTLKPAVVRFYAMVLVAFFVMDFIELVASR